MQTSIKTKMAKFKEQNVKKTVIRQLLNPSPLEKKNPLQKPKNGKINNSINIKTYKNV